VQSSAARLIAGILVAAIGVYSGFLLAAYAEADDAPGGVVLATILMLGSVGLGIWIAFRRPRKPSRNGG
jgi:hypothetical protein